MDPTDTAPHARQAPPASPQPAPGRASLLAGLARQGHRAVVAKLSGSDKPPAEAGDETIMHAPCL